MRFIAVNCESFGGFGSLRGILRADGDHLVLEYQHRDAMFGVKLSAAKRIMLPLTRIDRIEFRRGLFGLRPCVEISTDDFEFASHASSRDPGSVRFRVRFGDRRNAAAFAEYVGAIAAELRHRRWRSEVDSLIGQATTDIAPAPLPNAQTRLRQHGSESDA